MPTIISNNQDLEVMPIESNTVIEEQSKMDKYIGILKDDLPINTEDYLKIRKEEAEIIEFQKEMIEQLAKDLKKEKFDLSKILIGLSKTGTPAGLVNTALAYILAELATLQDNQQALLVIGSWVITIAIYGLRFILDKVK
jgi:hypothetical protein